MFRMIARQQIWSCVTQPPSKSCYSCCARFTLTDPNTCSVEYRCHALPQDQEGPACVQCAEQQVEGGTEVGPLPYAGDEAESAKNEGCPRHRCSKPPIHDRRNHRLSAGAAPTREGRRLPGRRRVSGEHDGRSVLEGPQSRMLQWPAEARLVRRLSVASTCAQGLRSDCVEPRRRRRSGAVEVVPALAKPDEPDVRIHHHDFGAPGR